jgi:hypothetical protein
LLTSGGVAGAADADWFDMNTNQPPTELSQSIYTQGRVGVNLNTPALPLHVLGEIVYEELTNLPYRMAAYLDGGLIIRPGADPANSGSVIIYNFPGATGHPHQIIMSFDLPEQTGGLSLNRYGNRLQCKTLLAEPGETWQTGTHIGVWSAFNNGNMAVHEKLGVRTDDPQSTVHVIGTGVTPGVLPNQTLNVGILSDQSAAEGDGIMGIMSNVSYGTDSTTARHGLQGNLLNADGLAMVGAAVAAQNDLQANSRSDTFGFLTTIFRNNLPEGFTANAITAVYSDVNPDGSPAGGVLFNVDQIGNTFAAGNLIAANFPASDERLKENIQGLELSLDKIKQLRGVTFNWKDKTKGEGSQYGLIAQEVEQVFPELVEDKAVDGEYKLVKYIGLIAPLIEAVKEQQNIIDQQNELITELLNRMDRVEKQIG